MIHMIILAESYQMADRWLREGGLKNNKNIVVVASEQDIIKLKGLELDKEILVSYLGSSGWMFDADSEINSRIR